MRHVTKIILHCSDSDILGQNAAVINSWHVARGWTKIGYHAFIGFTGMVEAGRLLDEVGAHVEGHNADSIGICLAGKKKTDFTANQFKALEMLLRLLKKGYPHATLHGHNEFNPMKLCPVFDVEPWKKLWDNLP